MPIQQPKIIAAFLGLFAALFAGTAKAETAEPKPERKGGPAEVERMARGLASILGLSNPQTSWLVKMHLAQAHSESGGRMNNLAANRTTSERKASRRLFYAERSAGTNAEILGRLLGRNIASDEDWFTPGSGGWFGLFAVNLLNILGGREAKDSDGFGPKWIFDPWASTVGYAAYVSRLIARSEWDRSTQDARAIKVGGAAGSLMDDPEKERYQKAVANLDKAIKAQRLGSDFRTTKPGIENIYRGRNWLAVYREGRSRGL